MPTFTKTIMYKEHSGEYIASFTSLVVASLSLTAILKKTYEVQLPEINFRPRVYSRRIRKACEVNEALLAIGQAAITDTHIIGQGLYAVEGYVFIFQSRALEDHYIFS